MYDHRVSDVSAFVLAGGKSSRMGSDKALLELAGQTLLSRAVAVSGSVSENVWIVGDSVEFPSAVRVVKDVYPGQGPLGGIHAALNKTSSPLNLILAVDLPFIEPGFLRYLISQAQDSAAVVTLSHAAGGWQPLCAVYRREFLETADTALRDGKNKIDALFDKVTVRAIREDELTGLGFSRDMFRNLNTPEDLERARRNWR